MDRSQFEPVVDALYDVTDCVKTWGRRGIMWGGLFGFALGIAFAAIPFTTDVLTFGVAGTLLVAAVEGAFIAGAFGACAAALYSKGVRRGSNAAFDRILPTSRHLDAGWRDGDIPLSDWPSRRPLPAHLPHVAHGTDDSADESGAPTISAIRTEEPALTPSQF